MASDLRQRDRNRFVFEAVEGNGKAEQKFAEGL